MQGSKAERGFKTSMTNSHNRIGEVNRYVLLLSSPTSAATRSIPSRERGLTAAPLVLPCLSHPSHPLLPSYPLPLLPHHSDSVKLQSGEKSKNPLLMPYEEAIKMDLTPLNEQVLSLAIAILLP